MILHSSDSNHIILVGFRSSCLPTLSLRGLESRINLLMSLNHVAFGIENFDREARFIDLRGDFVV